MSVISSHSWMAPDCPLFLDTNHSITEQKTVEVSAQTLEQVRAAFAEWKGVAPISSIQQFGARELASNNFLIKLEDGKEFVLKRLAADTSPDLLCFTNKVAAHLGQRNITVPVALPLTNGLLIASSGSSLWTLSTRIPNRGYFSGAPQQVYQAAQLLSNMLAAFGTISISECEAKLLCANSQEVGRWRHGISREIAHPLAPLVNQLLDDIVTRNPVSALHFDMVCHMSAEMRQMANWLDFTASAGSALISHKAQLLHNDFHPHNILEISNSFEDGGGVALLDFGAIIIGNPMSDISFGFHRLVRQCANRHGPAYIDDAITSFFNGFEGGDFKLDHYLDTYLYWGISRIFTGILEPLDEVYLKADLTFASDVPKYLNSFSEMCYLCRRAHELGYLR